MTFLANAWRGHARTWQVFLSLVVLPFAVHLTYLGRLGVGGILDLSLNKILLVEIPWASIQIFGAICLWKCAFQLRWRPLGYLVRTFSILVGMLVVVPPVISWFVVHSLRKGEPAATAQGYGQLSPPETLLAAIDRGDRVKIDELVRGGVSPNIRNKRGMTALQVAAVIDNNKVAELLVERGAEIDAKSTQAGSTPLAEAARWGHADLVKLLISKKAEVNWRANNGRTPLMEAAFFGHVDVIKVLIQNGAAVNAATPGGDTALRDAISSRNPPAALQLLLESGADPNATNKAGNTPLQMATGLSRQDYVDLLKRFGAK